MEVVWPGAWQDGRPVHLQRGAVDLHALRAIRLQATCHPKRAVGLFVLRQLEVALAQLTARPARVVMVHRKLR